jgi:putative photosynthetic complex assembly protein 2
MLLTFWHLVWPLLFVLAFWWVTTVVMLYRTGLPERSYAATMFAATALAVLSIVALLHAAEQNTIIAALQSFSAGVLLWGWHEVSYYTGVVTGPRAEACPPECSNWQRFMYGIKASLWHELAIVLTAAVLLIISWGASNQLAAWTFIILWLMRWSTKLNIFFGVPNLHEEFWPEHLRYLSSYVSHKPMNLLFPLSVSVSTIATALFMMQAWSMRGDEYQLTAAMLLGTISLLGLLEHWLLVLPLSDSRLWQWGYAAHERREAAKAANHGRLSTARSEVA